jgi:tetratricopeptide (TPR) repeat protein/tRNA A-37 threonylcarbamoyl transferase component Bud32
LNLMIGRTLSHYRILEKLGEGGMGVVYVAEDTLLGRRVAIKMLHGRRNKEDVHFRARFLREARAVSGLSHPHIATIHDYGESEDGEPYIVMELIKGETLGDLMLTEKLTIARSIDIIKQVGEALSEAHRQGIIHRDIKPTNVAINERGRVKVLDFGLAKQVALGEDELSDTERQTLMVTHTREGVVVGTPMYLSPEQAMGTDVDPRTDLFSLGGLLYECIAGKHPFFGKSAADICAKVMRDDPDPPSTLNPDIPQELDRITLKAMAKKPEARYQNAEELIADLESVQANLFSDASNAVTRFIPPVVGTRSTGARATLSDIFRRPRLPVGYVVAAVLGVIIVVFGLWYFLHTRPHQPNAEAQRLYETGTDALRAGSFFQASKALGLAIRSDDQFALAHARLAEAWMELDYTDKAKDELLRVGELSPDRSLFTTVDSLYLDAITATVRRDFSRAVTAYVEIARLQPNQSYAYVDLGRAYEKNNELDKAIESYTTAVQKDPQNATAFLRLGVLHGRKHDNEAGAAFDKADTIYQAFGNVEGRAEVALQRGVLLNDISGKVDEARAQLEQAREFARVVANIYQQIRILYQLSNVAIKAGQTDQSLQYADEAIQLAQANQMESLIARGNIEIGNIYLGAGKYDEAEQHFQRALDAAQRYGARQNEARARLTLASVYVQRGEADRALGLIDQALSFYQAGGYRTEVRQASILRARTFRQKGDYKSALLAFQDQLSQAEQSGDQSLIAFAHGSVGGVLLAQEQYAEARRHFEEGRVRYKSTGNKLYEGYALMNLGITVWHLGNYEEAHSLLKQAAEIANQKGSSLALAVSLDLVEAEMALSMQKFSEAESKAKHALDLGGMQDKALGAQAKILIALSQARSGRGTAGLALCQQAHDTATTTQGDPLLLALARLCVAEAAFLTGDNRRAIENASQAQTFFSNSGMSESSWRASLFAGLASQKNLDRDNSQRYLKSANDTFSSLEQKWGAETFRTYQARPDIQFYRRQLDQSLRSLGK